MNKKMLTTNGNIIIQGLNELILWMLEKKYSGFGGPYLACWCPGS